MKSNTSFSSIAARRSRGMSLIEILVGLAIAMVAMLIVFQVFSSSSQRVRTTTSGGDAQISGSLALYQLEHDLNMAGMGFGLLPAVAIPANPGSVAGCTVAAHQGALAVPDFTFPLMPVQIIPNATPGAPMQIAVTYGDSAYLVQGRGFVASTNTSKTLVSRDAFQIGDVLLVTDTGTSAAGACALVQITDNTNALGNIVDHNPLLPPATPFPFYPASTYPAGTVTPFTMNAAAGAFVATSGTVYNLGPTPRRNLWQVTPAGAANPNMLVWNNTLLADTQFQVAEGVVNLQAEYGVDNGAGGAVAGDGIISASEWTPNAPADPSLVLAVRFAVLVRSQQYETTAVTTEVPFWANDTGLTPRTTNDGSGHKFMMFNVDGTADSTPGNTNDWRHYRYRVYESVVPLRNMIWGKT